MDASMSCKWKSNSILPEVTEPLDELCSVVFVEKDVGKVSLEYGRTGVPDVEEHQLGLSQVHRGEGASVRLQVKVVTNKCLKNSLVIK